MLLIATCPSMAVLAHELLPEARSGAGRREAGSPVEFQAKLAGLPFGVLPACRRHGESTGLAHSNGPLLLASRQGFPQLAAETAFKKAKFSYFSIGCKQENILSRINSLTH
jgi:hypothetical protein